MKLSREERNILEGGAGPTLQRIMKAAVLYGEALGAERFVDIEGPGHLVCPYATPALGPPVEMLDELVEAGLRTKFPFTLDPRAPQDFDNLLLSPEQETGFEQMLADQPRYDRRMLELGLRDEDAYTCTPYLPEVGNVPARGTILAWSESSCVVFANSVLAARTNRIPAIMDIFLNILGKAPLAGFLTDEGRRAKWLVKIDTSELPNPQLLGAAIGMKVLEDTPYICGLDRFLGPGLDGKTIDFLKEMGAGSAVVGAVGLYHVDNITPEAVEQGTDLLTSDFETLVITDSDLEEVLGSYAVLWADKSARPQKCFIGCPHLSLRELCHWTDTIHEALEERGRGQVAVPTILCAAPQVLRVFQADKATYGQARRAGLSFSPTCADVYMANPLCSREAVITNSNKLRTSTPARLLLDEELVEVVASGEIEGES